MPEEKFGYSSFYPVHTKSGAVAMIDCKEPVSNGLYVFVQSDISDLDLYNLNRYNKWFVCVDCGEIYSLSNGEILSYRKKELCLPKRCLNCRNVRRKEKQSRELNNTSKIEPVSATSVFGG